MQAIVNALLVDNGCSAGSSMAIASAIGSGQGSSIADGDTLVAVENRRKTASMKHRYMKHVGAKRHQFGSGQGVEHDELTLEKRLQATKTVQLLRCGCSKDC